MGKIELTLAHLSRTLERKVLVMETRTLKNRNVVELLPFTAEVLDVAGTPGKEAYYFLCLTCEKSYYGYSNTCCGNPVQPVCPVQEQGLASTEAE